MESDLLVMRKKVREKRGSCSSQSNEGSRNRKGQGKNIMHELWQRTFDVKQCRTEKFILQKLNCIHNNPCSGKWNLCGKPYQYPYSAAPFYDGDKTGYRVKDYLDVLAELKYGSKGGG